MWHTLVPLWVQLPFSVSPTWMRYAILDAVAIVVSMHTCVWRHFSRRYVIYTFCQAFKTTTSLWRLDVWNDKNRVIVTTSELLSAATNSAVRQHQSCHRSCNVDTSNTELSPNQREEILSSIKINQTGETVSSSCECPLEARFFSIGFCRSI